MSGQQTLKRILADFNERVEMRKAHDLAELTLEQLKLPQLIGKIEFEFNNRFINLAGDAKLTKTPIYITTDKDRQLGWGPSVAGWSYGGKVRLGTKYFAVSAEEDKVETVIHEVCHVADGYLRIHDKDWILSNYAKTKGHGNGWKILMERVGYKNASPTHCLNTKQFKSYYKFTCPCGHTGMLTAQMGGRIINQTTYRQCTKCKKVVLGSYLKKVSGAELTYG